MLDEPLGSRALPPLHLVLLLLLRALHRLERNDLLLRFSTGLQLAWRWPGRRRHISQFFNERLMQFDAFRDQEFFVLGQLHKLQHPHQIRLPFDELLHRRQLWPVVGTASTSHPVGTRCPKWVRTKTVTEIVPLPIAAPGCFPTHDGLLI